MSITSLIGSRLITGIGALAIAGSVAGGTAVAAKGNDNPVRELRHELRDSTKAEREEIKDLRKQLADEYAKDNPDAAKMEALHEQIEAKRASISDMRFTAFVDMHDELDAKQREKVAEHLAKGKAKGKHKAEAKGKGKHKAEAKGKHKAERGEDDDRPAKGKSKAEVKGKAKGKDKAEQGKAKAERGKAKERRPA